MDIISTIDDFINKLKALGYAKTTIEMYSRNLEFFKNYLLTQNLTDLRKVTHKLILDYQEKVMAEPISSASKGIKIRPIKRLFEYLVENNKLLIDPTENIVNFSKNSKKIMPVLSQKEIKRIFEQPDLSNDVHFRNRTILEVMYSTAVRLDELINIKIIDIDLNEKVIMIRKAKGKKQRMVPLGQGAAKYLSDYLKRIRPWFVQANQNEDTLFLTQYGKPLSPSLVRGFLRNYRLSAEIEKNVSPHTFRRTCATHFLQQGADIRYVQELLGHKNLRTTQFYTKIKPSEVKKIHERTHPGVKEKNDLNKKEIPKPKLE
jgi:integrase/recombinase XerD